MNDTINPPTVRCDEERALSLPEICVELHMINTGASDSTGYLDRRSDLRGYLAFRLENWSPSTAESGSAAWLFDATVQALCQVALDEKGWWTS